MAARPEDLNKMIMGTTIKLMDAVRKDYLKTEAKLREEEEERRLK